jgi:serine/threonine-protein kinase
MALTDSLDSLRAALAPRYTLERELGRGGMATVYLARDEKLGRPVAIKVLSSDLRTMLGPDRFLHEIEVTSRLNHPHILALHDSGGADGRPFYVMPYVEGESLRDRLEREKQLSVDETVRIASAVAAALDHAHHAGVLHRDVKPENILLAKDRAGGPPIPLVADFGIAHALDAVGGTRLTATGLALGTPAYMSPEQASASLRLDGRSDVYALGCVVYEMLAGAPPFTGPTAQAIRARHAVDPVPPLRTVRVTVPETIERAVEKALAKVPADRFDTAGELAAALTAVAQRGRPRRAAVLASAGVAALVAMAIGSRLLPERGTVGVRDGLPAESATSLGGTRAGKPVVAVLPFTSTGSDGRGQYFAQAMHQEMVARLGMLGGLSVIDRETMLAYRDSAIPLARIGNELKADFVLRGEATDNSAHAGLAVRLSDVHSGQDVWSQSYHREPSDAGLSVLRSEIVRGIAGALEVKISSVERGRISGRSAENAAAFDLVLRASQLDYGRDLAASAAAEELLKQAIALDSGFASAVAQLGEVYSVRSYTLGESRVWADSALRLARRAIELDSTLAWGYHTLGLSYLDQGRLRRAAEVYGRIIQYNPSDGQALKVLGWIELLRGRLAEAMPLFLDAQVVAPLDAYVLLDLNVIAQLFGDEEYSGRLRHAARALDPGIDPLVGLLLDEGRTGEAVTEAERFLASNPRSPSALRAAAKAAIAASNYPRAREHLDVLHRIGPDDWDGWGLTYRTAYADVLLRTGERQRAMKLLGETLRDAQGMVNAGDERPGVLREIAAIHMANGDSEQAYAWFIRALDAGWRLEMIHPSPLLYALGGEQRFQELRARMEFSIRGENERLVTQLGRATPER